MPDSADHVDRALQSLSDVGWDDPAHQRHLEQELTRMHTTRLDTARPRRLRKLAIIALLLLIGGSATGGTYAWLNRVHLYDFEVRRGDEVIGSPRVIVSRGQTASVSIGAEDASKSFTILIDFDGTTTLIGPPDLVMDVVVVAVEIDR
jgi:hypothetical protein